MPPPRFDKAAACVVSEPELQLPEEEEEEEGEVELSGAAAVGRE